ncbi:mechanosensitive ion channel family protein [Rhodohalobacter halophilus]|uniref:mechanosensitive ion channel family protein n=1 Tax=Rhodohalobacter halophilus TaxID=1812810 RepID=UPI00083FACDD|nr:mechanosensitive ion channel family protein [Rhodohalobacter halophilus]
MVEYFSDLVTQYAMPIRVTIILIVTIFVAKLSKRLFKKFVINNTTEDENLTNYKFIEHSLSTIIYLIGFSFAIWNIPTLENIAQSMVAGAGILAIAVGFASQQALGNIISGLFIVIYKPYVINDRITLRTDLRGVVEDISLRHTVIRNFENQRIIIPNSVISNEVLINSNFSDSKICRLIDVGISYGSDIDLAKKIIAEEVENHPLSMDVRKPEDIENGAPRVLVRLTGLMDSSVTLRGWAWAKDAPDAFTLQCDVLESIKKRFDQEGIVIPFPQRTISYLNEPTSKEES